MSLVSKLLWGTGFENELRIGYPFFDIVTDREERAGSAHAQAGDGSEVAWIAGRDYVMDTEVRWIPDGPTTAPVQTPLSGPVSWQEFLDWARVGNAFRFQPDETVPGFYADNTYLMEPRKGFGSLSSDIKRNVRLKLRNPAVDFHQLLRGVMFEYAPGMSLVDPTVATFARTTTATRRGIPGTLAGPIGASEAAGVLRDRHYEGSVRTTLLEGERIQLITSPENFAAWTALGAILTAGQADPFGGTAAYLLDDADAVNNDTIAWSIPFTGDATKAISIFMRQGTAALSAFQVRDDTLGGIQRHMVRVTWTAGVPVLSTIAGSGIRFPVEDYGAGWWRLSVTADGVVASSVNNLYLYPAGETGSAVGTTYMFGANAWNDAYPPASYQGPTILTRDDDQLSWAHPYAPQPVFFYYKGVWRSVAVDVTALMNIGQFFSGVGQRILMYGSAGGLLVISHGDSASTRPQPAYGDTIELLGYVDELGRARIIRSVNGGAEDAGSLSGTTEAFPAAYTRQLFDLGHEAGVVTTKRATATAIAKYGPYTFRGQNVDTIAKARAV